MTSAWTNPGAAAGGYLDRPEFQPFAGPRGDFHQSVLEDSRLYPGFRHWWGVYTPAPAFAASRQVGLMVFQDGEVFADEQGPWRTREVLDNLIGRGELPPLVAVFVAPGIHVDGANGAPQDDRSIEYDTLSPRYGAFLTDEILPLARRFAPWSDDPNLHGIGGHSSGAICAFTVAWDHPDLFRKVYSANGSFTNIRGGNAYPDIVHGGPKKPLRIYQWSDEHDMSNPQWGDWAAANHKMAAALQAAGYDHLFEFGQGTHDPRFAAARFAGAMRWLWRA